MTNIGQTGINRARAPKWRAYLFGGLGALLAVGLVACAADDSGDTGIDDVPTASVVTDQPEGSGTAVPNATIEAEILDATSEDVEINSGDSVIWRNSDDEARTISGEGFDETTIEPGEAFTHTFTEEGTYEINVEGGESFAVTVLVALPPEAQSTGVPRVPAGTPSGN